MSGFLHRRSLATTLLRAAPAVVLVACGVAPEPMSPGRAPEALSRGGAPEPMSLAAVPGPMSAERALRVAPRTLSAAPSGPVCGGADPHAKHLNSGMACTVCHPAGGQFGFANVLTYPRGTSTAGGFVTRTAGAATTCTVACHFPMGGPAHATAWVPGSLDCTACHSTAVLPPAHPAVAPSATRAVCESCHTASSHTQGTVTLVGHAAAWMNQADPGFHAVSANRGLAQCQTCHLADLSGGVTGFSCARCHDATDPAGATIAWKTNCVMCHGGTDNPTGAPPRATWGNAADAVRAGAHTSHVTAGALAPASDCGACHVKPSDALSAGHVDGGTATVVFAGVASSGTTPSWDRGTATCSNTYCHGATLGGGTNKSPNWTLTGRGQAACGTCHGLPPPAPHPDVAADLTRCATCHGLTIDAAGRLIPPGAGGQHLDGIVEANGHAASWMDAASPRFHAFSANLGIAACTNCHGADLSGGTAGVACASCHDGNLPAGVASWRTNCVMCHGGKDNATGAPPQATWGNSADAVRVGAHTAHVTGGPIAVAFDCAVCHVKPTDALSTGHVDGATATVTWSGLAKAGGAAPFWNRPAASCSSTYCHGNYSGTFAYTAWDFGTDTVVTKYAPYAGKNAAPLWTDGPKDCSSCHGNPPVDSSVWHSGVHGGGNQCELCHPDASGTPATGTAISDPSLHINGTVDVVVHWKTTCTNCH